MRKGYYQCGMCKFSTDLPEVLVKHWRLTGQTPAEYNRTHCRIDAAITAAIIKRRHR